jgi:putative tryptophan/tyrosine transport system substrate-binding protein
MDLIGRRHFLVATGALIAAPLSGSAQQGGKVVRVGWASFNPAGTPRANQLDGFRAALRAYGWVEGKTIVIDARAGDRGDASAMAKAFLANKIDVIVATGPMVGGVRAQAGATPVVFVMTGDPVEMKWAATLAHPGGNLTGLSALALELESKRLELLKELKPGMTRVAVLANSRHPGYKSQLNAAQDAAKRLGLTLHSVPVVVPADFETAFSAVTQGGVEAIISFPDGLVEQQAQAIARYATRRRIPSMGGFSSFVEDGNLMSYGPVERDFYGRAAYFVDRIARGAKPADLPVELPTTFELVINMKAAKGIGIRIPQSILVRADKVIE